VTLGGALAIMDALVVDARLSGSHQIGDRLIGTGNDKPLDRWVPHDLRIGARIRVNRERVFLRGDLTLPSGDEGDFAGEPSWTIAWRLIARARLPAGIVAAATVGLRLRGEEVLVADRLVGNELVGAAGIAVPIPPLRPLWCVADQVKLTAEIAGVLGDEVGASGRGPSPLEARVGLVTRPLENLTFGARLATGLVDEIGAPVLRATIELSYQP
jgi:hypothetical protein